MTAEGLRPINAGNSKLIHDYYSVNCMEGSCQTVPYERKYQGGGKVNPLYGKGNAVDIPKEFSSYTLISDAKVFREGGIYLLLSSPAGQFHWSQAGIFIMAT